MQTYRPDEIIPVDEALRLLRKCGTCRDYSDYTEEQIRERFGILAGISPLGELDDPDTEARPDAMVHVDDAERLLRKWGTSSGYTTGEMRKLVGAGISPLGIVALDVLPIAERLWILLREEFFSPRDRRLLACRWAEAVLPLFERDCPGDTRPREAIATARRHAYGKASDEELAAARTAAWPATVTTWPSRDAAEAAGNAARATLAATLAAPLAADMAACAACAADACAADACAAACAAARDARVAQLADVRAVLEGVAVENLPLEVSQ